MSLDQFIVFSCWSGMHKGNTNAIKYSLLDTMQTQFELLCQEKDGMNMQDISTFLVALSLPLTLDSFALYWPPYPQVPQSYSLVPYSSA